MAQVVEHSHEDHDVEPLAERAHVIDRELAELDVHLGDFRRETCLRQIGIIEVEAENAFCAPPLHLDRVETGIAANVENRLSGEVGGYRILEFSPFHMRIVAEKMVRRSGDAIELDIVEPGPELLDPLLYCGVRHPHGWRLHVENYCTPSFRRMSLAPQPPMTITVIEAGSMSKRKPASSARPSTWQTAVLITSAWLTRTTPVSGYLRATSPMHDTIRMRTCSMLSP